MRCSAGRRRPRGSTPPSRRRTTRPRRLASPGRGGPRRGPRPGPGPRPAARRHRARVRRPPGTPDGRPGVRHSASRHRSSRHRSSRCRANRCRANRPCRDDAPGRGQPTPVIRDLWMTGSPDRSVGRECPGVGGVACGWSGWRPWTLARGSVGGVVAVPGRLAVRRRVPRGDRPRGAAGTSCDLAAPATRPDDLHRGRLGRSSEVAARVARTYDVRADPRSTPTLDTHGYSRGAG